MQDIYAYKLKDKFNNTDTIKNLKIYESKRFKYYICYTIDILKYIYYVIINFIYNKYLLRLQ